MLGESFISSSLPSSRCHHDPRPPPPSLTQVRFSLLAQLTYAAFPAGRC